VSKLEIVQFPCLDDNYGYLVHAPGTGETATIDTPDADAIAAAVADLLTGTDEWSSLSAAGTRYAQAHFSTGSLRRALADALELKSLS